MITSTRLAPPCLIALLPVLLTGFAAAQGTIRPLPRVARSWEASASPASGKVVEPKAREAAVDLDFIGPLPLERQRETGETAPAPPAEPVDFTDVEFFLLGVGTADFTEGQGQLAVQRGGWRASVGRRQPDGTCYAFEIDSEASFYDFGGGVSPVPGVADPFNDVYETSLSGRFLARQSERLEWYGGVQLGVAGEDRAKFSDAVWVGGAMAMRYEAAPRFALLAGVAGVSRFEDSPWILPYVGFDWQVTDSLRVLTEAAEIHVDYSPGEKWSLGAVAAYGFRQYRLNEEGPLHGGAFRDEEIRLGGSIGYEPTPAVELGLEVGTLLWREVVFFDGQGGDLGEVETSSPIYLRFGLNVGF
jgi:hypothetical protein